MKLVLGVILGIFIATAGRAEDDQFEVTIERVEPYIFGKKVSENTQMVVGDLKGKILGKVLVGDLRGKLSLYILACNESDSVANVLISAFLNDSNGKRLWGSESSSPYPLPPNVCPTGIGYVLYGDDYEKGLPVSEIEFPVHLVIKYKEPK